MSGGQGKDDFNAFGAGEAEHLGVADGKMTSIRGAGEGEGVRGFGEDEELGLVGGADFERGGDLTFVLSGEEGVGFGVRELISLILRMSSAVRSSHELEGELVEEPIEELMSILSESDEDTRAEKKQVDDKIEQKINLSIY